MREIKTVLVSVCFILLVRAVFCIYWIQPKEKVGHHNKIDGQGPCKKEYKNYCLNDGEWFFLIDEDFVGCKCTWLYEWKCCKKNYVVELGEILKENVFPKNRARFDLYNSKTDTL